MKKSILISISAALLLCAVLCTAGCVSEDQIAGDWLYITDDAASVLHFEANETGVLAELAASETDELVYEVAAETSFDWKKTGASEYQLTFPDKTTETVTVDMQKGTLVFRGQTYEEQLSRYSGSARTEEHIEQMMEQMREEIKPEGAQMEQPEQPTGGHTSGVKVEPGYEYLQWITD